jgi:hypothetical protein
MSSILKAGGILHDEFLEPISRTIMGIILDDKSSIDDIKSNIHIEFSKYDRNKSFLLNVFRLACEYENFGIIKYVIEDCSGVRYLNTIRDKSTNKHIYCAILNSISRINKFEIIEYLFQSSSFYKSDRSHIEYYLMILIHHNTNSTIEWKKRVLTYIHNEFKRIDPDFIAIYPHNLNIFNTLMMDKNNIEILKFFYKLEIQPKLDSYCTTDLIMNLLNKILPNYYYPTSTQIKFVFDVIIPDIPPHIPRDDICKYIESTELASISRWAPRTRWISLCQACVCLFKFDRSKFPICGRARELIFTPSLLYRKELHKYLKMINDIIEIDPTFIERYDDIEIEHPRLYFDIGSSYGYISLLKYIIHNYTIDPYHDHCLNFKSAISFNHIDVAKWFIELSDYTIPAHYYESNAELVEWVQSSEKK